MKAYHFVKTAFPGTRVYKTSGKPFKSGQKENTVKGYCIHPTLRIPCYTFHEDDSYVECWRCIPKTMDHIMNTKQLRKLVNVIVAVAAANARNDYGNGFNSTPPDDILDDGELCELYIEAYTGEYERLHNTPGTSFKKWPWRESNYSNKSGVAIDC